MKTLKLKCNNCDELENYSYQDLEVSQTPDDLEVNLSCKKCGDPEVGGQKELESLLEDYPQYDPDPDEEYDRTVEKDLIEKEPKK